MRGLAPFAALVLLAAPAAAQQNLQQSSVPAPVTDGSDARVEALQQRLLASQQTIATLERELADAQNHSAALGQCRTKNGRLVSIGRQLIEGYERRYRLLNHHDPLQLGRRRFEFELQALTDVVYDNRVDVPVHFPGDLPALTDTPAKPDEPAKPATKPAKAR